MNVNPLPVTSAPFGDPRRVTQTPVTTGTSILGIRFNGGVVLAGDKLASYGSLARFRDCPRVIKVNESTFVGCTGDYADFQYLQKIIEQQAIDDDAKDDGFRITPKSLYSWLTRVLYNKRSKFDPLWTTFVVGGIQDGKEFLAHVDKLGTAYEDPVIATGYGAYIATPLLRSAYEAKQGNLTEQEALQVIDECMKVLYYRDARAFSRYLVGVIRNVNGEVSSNMIEPPELATNWEIAHHAVD